MRCTWPYGTHGMHDEPNVNEVLKEINGRDLDRPASCSKAIKKLKNDGSTACGCWIYCGIYPKRASEQGQPARAEGLSRPRLGILLAQRHVASSTTAAPRVPMASRGASARSSSGGTRRSASGPVSTSRLRQEQAARLPADAEAQRAWTRIAGDKPFILHPDGVGWLYVTSGLKDGPLPTHYEPLEIAVRQSAVSRAASTIPRPIAKSVPTIRTRMRRR